MGSCASTEQPISQTMQFSKKATSNVLYNGYFYLQIKSLGKMVHLVNNSRPHYFPLRNGAPYSIILGNNGPTKCDVRIELDNVFIGLYRVGTRQKCEIERPSGIQQQFIFSIQHYALDDSSNSSNSDVSTNNGKLKAIFYPENQTAHSTSSDVTSSVKFISNMIDLSGSGGYIPDLDDELYSGGSTKLGGHSSQTFTDLKGITEIDQSRVTTIDARFVINNTC